MAVLMQVLIYGLLAGLTVWVFWLIDRHYARVATRYVLGKFRLPKPMTLDEAKRRIVPLSSFRPGREE